MWRGAGIPRIMANRRAPDQGLLGHGTDLSSVAVLTAMRAMVVSIGLSRAVLGVPVAVVGFGVVDPRDRDRRRDDDLRWRWGCRRWCRWNGRDRCRGDRCRGDRCRGGGCRGGGCRGGG